MLLMKRRLEPSALLVIACLGLGCGSKGPTADVARELLTEHNRGIAHLQNHEWAEAETALSKVRTSLPESPVAARNLAVSRTLAIIATDPALNKFTEPAKYDQSVEVARAAIAELKRLARSDEERAVAAMLLGRVAAHSDSPEKPTIDEAMASMDEAIRLTANPATMYFTKAALMSAHRDLSESPDLIATMQKAFDSAPENLTALIDLLEKQAAAALSHDPESQRAAEGLKSNLERAIPLVAPFNPMLVKLHRQDLVDRIQKAVTGPTANNPQALAGLAMMTKNLIVGEVAARIDRRRISQDLLVGYLDRDLRPDLKLSASVQAELFPPAEATVLQKFTAGNPAVDAPIVSEVTDVQAVDMNLDGEDDLVVIEGGRIAIYAHRSLAADDPRQENSWRLLCRTGGDDPLFQRLLVADFDRDYDRVLSDIKEPFVLRDRDGDRKIVKDLSGEQRWFDTDSDVVAWNESEAALFLGEPAGNGERMLRRVADFPSASPIRDIVTADLESDGDLDLIVATTTGITLWRSLDGVQFEEVKDGYAGPQKEISALAIGDWNRDIAMDVIGISPDGTSGWLQNLLHGRFRWIEGLPGVAGGADVILDELNSDGLWELVIAGESETSLVRIADPEVLTSATGKPLQSSGATRMHRADFDNDGRSDVLMASADKLQLLRGTGEATFEDLSARLPDLANARAVTSLDHDDDGDLDVIVVNAAGSLELLVNEGGNSNNWIDIVARPIGNDDQFKDSRVNMHAIGATIELRAGASYQAHVIDAPKLHLGIGKQEKLDVIRVIWTDGIPQTLTDTTMLRARLGVLAPQMLKGSCPYIYTWNGERFEFFSDCLWAAPLGLIQASGDLAPTREWEYLLVSGTQLQPRGDKYAIQLTEELWEAAYFDEVKLVAVDHPADVSVFTNEKVGSPEMAAHRVHTVRDRRPPVAATNGLGRNLLSGLESQDQDYVQPFRSRVMQGLTDEWTLELDPGDLRNSSGELPKSVRLVLIGWVFPTDTSLNEAIQQNPGLDPPAAPSIEVVDESGQWVTASPFIGFPSGKKKAMVVDVSDMFASDDRRIRLRSSMELYFDQAFFIVDEADAETRQQDCPLVSADLHYRGFSRRTYSDSALFRNGHAPEGYDYDSVTTEPRWNEMLGRFTRYGDVRSLLESHDDRMIVMGPGDEVTVEFSVPADPPPAGWTRDFVLYNVGWDKDADLNTVYGQSAEPYPTRGMSQYPMLPADSAVPSVERAAWEREFQTREYPRFQLRDSVRVGP